MPTKKIVKKKRPGPEQIAAYEERELAEAEAIAEIELAIEEAIEAEEQRRNDYIDEDDRKEWEIWEENYYRHTEGWDLGIDSAIEEAIEAEEDEDEYIKASKIRKQKQLQALTEVCLFANIPLNADVRGIIGSFLILHKTPRPDPDRYCYQFHLTSHDWYEITVLESAIEDQIEDTNARLEWEDFERWMCDEAYWAELEEAEWFAEIDFKMLENEEIGIEEWEEHKKEHKKDCVEEEERSIKRYKARLEWIEWLNRIEKY